MPSLVSTQGCTEVSLKEEVADALDNAVGHFVELGTTADELSIKLANDNDSAIGVVVSKLKQTTGAKEPVSIALIDAGGIARVRAGGTIAKGAGVSVASDGEAVTAVLGTADTVGIAMEAAVDQDLFPVLLSRQTPA